ncbi:sulfite exporter TauE/SafE family protein [Micrococcus sp. FDAARGOS_333]|uniref:sulfite exporter TauE/SafE family protein n=1 Tax=Micrococcus sp. FDAARGOS_333 TaxID=1930558 RepID=UPI000B4E62C3|nr:sulfite exporter TauE/SafE family protein [Micrococcus sp. FDAARGOS_333]PNL18000.1 sulfite exporter TauE/SafE family protein [Micrococcus sp. FDAARGOS_333]
MMELLTADVLGLELWQVMVVLLAGFWAGTINSIVGSGTLVTFPVLVAVGFPPVTAQISNAMGLVAAGFSGTVGYRRELKQSMAVVPVLTVASLLGGVIGAFLLTVLPERVFEIAAPCLIVVALGFVVFQPRLNRWVKARRAAEQGEGQPVGAFAGPVDQADDVPRGPVSPLLWALVFGAGVYGGYFVAAQGVLLMGILGVFLTGLLVHANAVKTWLSLCVNLVAAVFYLLFAFDRIDWVAVLLIAASSLVGGSVGARIGRRISPTLLRGVIVAVGLVGLAVMLLRLVQG